MTDTPLPSWARTTIVGYSDRIAVRPGESIDFKVSCEDGARTFHADIVRVICGDHHPDGPGLKLVPVDTPVAGEYPVYHQSIDAGSCVVVPGMPDLGTLPGFTVLALIWPTLPDRGPQAIISQWLVDVGCGFVLHIDAGGRLAATLGDGRGSHETVRSRHVLVPRTWYLVAATYDKDTREIQLHKELLGAEPDTPECDLVTAVTSSTIGHPGVPLVIAGNCLSAKTPCPRIGTHFNGKIDSPRVATRPLSRLEMHRLLSASLAIQAADSVLAAWDFSKDIQSCRVTDVSPNHHHGETVNLPARAMTGHNWTGEAMDWQVAPEHYGAIHFHEDDIYDAGWETSFTLDVPANLSSGIYAARVETESGRDHIPFVVRPRSGRPTAEICFLFSSATYMAYANSHKNVDSPMGREFECGGLLELGTHDLFLNAHREYGYSTYDTHLDGSGVCYSSRLRPILDMRPDSHIGQDARWNFVADTHIIDWLEAGGYAYDVITDEDLHDEGLALIAPYRVLISGTHPEYTSLAMWQALHAYRDRGGRLMYLGGNGFYWRIAYHPELPGVLEVRRAENGPRGWAAEPGEYYHSFTGEYGGLWRYLGRPPQALVGVGFSAAGFDASSYYRRQPGSQDPRASFIFEGIGEEELIGDFGVAGGGAAGWEVDIHDAALQAPANALVVATSEHHSNAYVTTPEDPEGCFLPLDGLQDPKARADMTFFECPNGGAVFSTGSIAWGPALSCNGYSNNVSRITRNVLDRFLDPAPL